MRATRPPRTLIVSWHWPPVERASSRVLERFFRAAPPGVFRTVTRGHEDEATRAERMLLDWESRVPVTRVRSLPDGDTPRSIADCLTQPIALRRFMQAACRAGYEWPAEQVLAVYPHRFSLFAGWRIARRLRLPLVLYMHDLCAEAITFPSRLRRWFWRAVDDRCLREASLVVVPTDEFARHYKRRGVRSTWVLPHCAKTRAIHSEPVLARDVLQLLYSGKVYEPHADAVRTFAAATRSMTNVNVTYLSNPDGCQGLMHKLGATWQTQEVTRAHLSSSDVCVVLLGQDTPCPEEVRGCFPSKVIDYLEFGKPILAVVPRGSFVARLIRSHRCGFVVTTYNKTDIRRAVEALRDPELRASMSDASIRLAGQLRADVWMERLVDRLAAPFSRTVQCTSPSESTGPQLARVYGQRGSTFDTTQRGPEPTRSGVGSRIVAEADPA